MFTSIGHVAFYIADLERSLDFYCNKLGFRRAFHLDREGKTSPWIVFLQVAPGQFLELFPGGQGAPEPRSERVGYNHFCLLVDDIHATVRELGERGVEIKGEPFIALDNNWQFWISDPDGNAIELIQIMPDSPQYTAEQSWS